MRKTTIQFCVLVVLIAPTGLLAQVKPESSNKVAGGIATLYALDPLMRTFCFADGKEGGVFQQNEVRNRCSDIDFNAYYRGNFTVGVEGGRLGKIVDLGSSFDLKQKYGYEETVGLGQGFASLRLDADKIVILKDRRSQEMQQVAETSVLFQAGTSGANAPIKLGHIYLVRLTDRHDAAFQRIVKFIVTAYTPNETVTIRWQSL